MEQVPHTTGPYPEGISKITETFKGIDLNEDCALYEISYTTSEDDFIPHTILCKIHRVNLDDVRVDVFTGGEFMARSASRYWYENNWPNRAGIHINYF